MDGQFELKISDEALRQSGLTLTEVAERAETVLALLPPRGRDHVPLEIRDAAGLGRLASLYSTLSPLVGQAGFPEFREQLHGEHFESHFFTARVARTLLPHVEKLILEPTAPGTSARPDILVIWNGHSVFIECKQLGAAWDRYHADHERIWQIVRDSIPAGKQITITYERTLTNEEARALAATIQRRLTSVTNTGELVRNDRVRVHYQWTEPLPRDHSVPGLRFRGQMLTHAGDKNCAYPGQLIGEDGKSVVLEGPRVSMKPDFRKALKRASEQAPPDTSFILAIDGRSALGSLDEFNQVVYSECQPGQNSRFSGVLLVDSIFTAPESAFHFIRNAFAKTPLPEGLEFQLARLARA